MWPFNSHVLLNAGSLIEGLTKNIVMKNNNHDHESDNHDHLNENHDYVTTIMIM